MYEFLHSNDNEIRRIKNVDFYDVVISKQYIVFKKIIAFKQKEISIILNIISNVVFVSKISVRIYKSIITRKIKSTTNISQKLFLIIFYRYITIRSNRQIK